MRDDICTIPISEIFEVNDGCPICRMYKTVEDRIIKYILGDAMMESDVRIETNRLGFCPDHYDKMLSNRGRLQLALMLETHIKEVNSNIFEKKLFDPPSKKVKKAEKVAESCFICSKIEWGVTRMTETIYRTYETQKDFRELFNNQPQFCIKHFEMLVRGIDKKKYPKHSGEMIKNITRITGDYLKELSADVSKYCSMYDYRSNKDDWGNSKDAVERAVGFLTGRIID